MASEKITALIEEVKNLTVLELSELVHELEDTFGVSAAAPVMVAGAAAAASVNEVINRVNEVINRVNEVINRVNEVINRVQVAHKKYIVKGRVVFLLRKNLHS